MTQNTQTTAQRILTILRDHLEFYAGSGEWAAATEAGEQIAAEIDALTAERDEAAKYRDQYVRECGELTAQLAEVERLRPAAEAWIAYDDYMMCPEEHEAEKFPVWVAAHKAAKSAQVARAAKESQP